MGNISQAAAVFLAGKVRAQACGAMRAPCGQEISNLWWRIESLGGSTQDDLASEIRSHLALALLWLLSFAVAFWVAPCRSRSRLGFPASSHAEAQRSGWSTSVVAILVSGYSGCRETVVLFILSFDLELGSCVILPRSCAGGSSGFEIGQCTNWKCSWCRCYTGSFCGDGAAAPRRGPRIQLGAGVEGSRH